MALIRLTPLQLKAYQSLKDGSAACQVASKLKVSRSTMFKVARRLVLDGYLIQITKVKPFMYGPGPRANEADLFAVSQPPSTPTDDGVAVCGTTVKGGQQATSIRTAKTHHIKVHFEVEKIGDLEEIKFKQDGAEYRTPFLKDAAKLYRGGLTRTYGHLSCPFGELAVELAENPKSKRDTLYVHLPDVDHTAEELANDKWMKLAMELGQSVGNWLQKWGGWKLGLMEVSAAWEIHHGVHYPELEKVLSNQYVRSDDGTVWTSGSEGRSELETSDAAKAKILVEIPNRVVKFEQNMEQKSVNLRSEVYELELTVSELITMVKHMAEAEEKAIAIQTLDIETRNGVHKEQEYESKPQTGPAPGYG